MRNLIRRRFFFSFSEPTSPPTTTHPTIKPVKDDSKGQSSFLPLIVGAIGAFALLFLIFLLIFIALKRRRDMVNTQREGEKRNNSRNSILIKKFSPPIFRARKQIESESHSKRLDRQWWSGIKFSNTPQPSQRHHPHQHHAQSARLGKGKKIKT